MYVHRFTAVILALACSISNVSASCLGINSTNNLKDGDLLFKTNHGWKPIDQIEAAIGNQRLPVSFAFIVRDAPSDKPRRGVVVVKSGFKTNKKEADDDPTDVTLYRPLMSKNRCSEARREFAEAKVPVTAYDHYHEDGFKTKYYGMFKEFHISYETAKRCRDTDSASSDGFVGTGRRSNLSQFSFDKDVVSSGTYELVLWPFRIGSAFASASDVVEKYVQIRKYALDEKGLDCVRFNAKVGPGAFFGVNDLENRTFLGGDNKTWNWSE